MHRWLPFLLWAALALPLSAQTPARAFGFEFQAYPTGLIPGLRFDYHFRPHHGLNARVGYNRIRHGDNGVQDNEQGDGFGGTLGYRYYFRADWSRWFLGLRSDIWRNRLDWYTQHPNDPGIEYGTSKIWVVQPTLEGGYQFVWGQGRYFFTPALAFGAEVNVKTDGAPVGEGAILLLGVSAGWRF